MKPPADIYRALVTAGDEMAEAEYNYRLLNDATKSILANTTLLAVDAENCSVAMAEKIALSANDYRDHLKACAETARIAERAKIRYFATKTYADHVRTAEATERAAMSSAT